MNVNKSSTSGSGQTGTVAPVVLTILDGWGHREDSDNNAIRSAETPVMEALRHAYPSTLIQASGSHVGLPDQQMGNSEVGHLTIGAQEPRAITVRDGKLYVVAFESGNQSELSGCYGVENIDGDQCTYDIDMAFDGSILPHYGFDVDIVQDPNAPDRDLFVFDTATDQPHDIVSTIGTLLYGVAVDSNGRVYVAQTDAQNYVNGRAGTLGHELIDLGNRPWLNQIGVVDCGPAQCADPSIFNLDQY